MVVVVHPLGGAGTNVIQGKEDVGVEEFAAQAAVEAFDEGILRGLSGLDEGEGDVILPAEELELVGDELRPVVQADHRRQTTSLFELLEHSDHTQGR